MENVERKKHEIDLKTHKKIVVYVSGEEFIEDIDTKKNELDCTYTKFELYKINQFKNILNQ